MSLVVSDGRVFRALAHPSRRRLLDRLHGRDGQTLAEMMKGGGMTRQGVSKHLQVLEEADLVLTERRGREKLHFLNPVPLQEIYDRWIGKYQKHRLEALVNLKAALEKEDEL
ncbi:MAG TPA: helix-turn-helix domain-containing protein [Allosphingosinicella sp.]|jgi:DNA-binding transcriptional ArsR family regulator|nr:helix-turn-helix domain-containing protein [Allosphingosinicella sp.]